MDLTVSDIALAVHAACPAGTEDVRCTGVTWDSRSVAPGDLYVALPGERVDGHDFAASAIDAGALAVLAQREVDVVAPVVIVDDVQKALADLARFWRKRLTGTVIGLTGSTGKTTTKNFVRDVLSHGRSVVATKANQNNELGVPRTLLEADLDTDSVVVEMGMRGLGQIAELCEVADPDWGLITNVGTSHIELLGSQQNIAKAKAELFEALPEGSGIAFVNAADGFARELCDIAHLEERGVQVVFYDGSDSADSEGKHMPDAPLVWASEISLDAEGRPSFQLNAVGFEQLGFDEANGSCPCTLNLLGFHNVSNACSAVAVGLASGMSLESCCEALESAQPEKGRQVVHHVADGITVIDDAYNANPDSMRASLATFSAMQIAGRRWAVLGDMLELGDYSKSSHEDVGRMAAAARLDKLVCVGDWSRCIASAAHDAGMPESEITLCATAEDALDVLKPQLQTGDAVLVKASHSIGLEHVVEGLVM